MKYKIGTSHQCRKCGGPVIADEADKEIRRLRESLASIADYWGTPQPLDSSHKHLVEYWRNTANHLMNVARKAIGRKELIAVNRKKL